MNNEQILEKLHERIEAGTVQRWRADQYYSGTQPISYLRPEDAKALGDRLRTLNVNFCRLQVEGIIERLKVEGFRGDGVPLTTVQDAWVRAGFDESHQTLFRESLIHGAAYVVVWADSRGRATLSVESAAEVAVDTDPLTGEPRSAVKRWQDGNTAHCVLFLPDTIAEYTVPCPAGGAIPKQGWSLVDHRPNPLGRVPVVAFVNRSRLLEDGHPEFDNITDLQDALVKLLTDMMVSSEYGSRPRRWATGLVVKVDPATSVPVNPFAEGPSRVWQNENPAGKFGQFDSADLQGYQTSIEQMLKLISSSAALPSHYMTLTNIPLSAESIRAGESALVARVEAKQVAFARSWLRVAELVLQVEGHPQPANIDVTWSDPASRTLAQQADAATKLFQSGVIPRESAQRLAGFSQDEIAEMRMDFLRGESDQMWQSFTTQPPEDGAA